jgi:ATPase family associated with various cellular activities (AAA)
MTDAYSDSIEHLRHELTRIDLQLRRAIAVTRARLSGSETGELRGLVISEHEIDSMAGPYDIAGEVWRAEELVRDELVPLDQQIAELRASIDRRLQATRAAGRALRLVTCAEALSLSQAEVDLLLLALAPEIEPRYETIYAYLQNDVTRKRPSVDLCLNVVCRGAREKLFARRLLAEDAPLSHYGVVDLFDEAYDRSPALLRKFVKVRESVVRTLLEQSAGAPELGTFAATSGEDPLRDIAAATGAQIRNLAALLVNSPGGKGVVYLSGTSAHALDAATRLLAHELGRPLLRVELAQIESEPWPRLASLARETLLGHAILSVRQSDELTDDSHAPTNGKNAAAAMAALALAARGPLIVAGASSAAADLPPSTQLWRVAVEPADYATRVDTWTDVLGGRGIVADAPRLADTFRFGADRIQQTGSLAHSLAVLRDPADPRPSMNDLLDAGRALTAANLRRFAIPIEPRYGWEDLVLPDDRMKQLRGVAARIKQRRKVHRDWGFGRKLARGKGVSVLFSGASGTGKTMAAEVLASELAIDLYQIDLSSVVSKYIGETERNLSAIFNEAENSQTLLFFDEADALYGKRTEVKDAHDRYANIEVDYLLQRMEQYTGPVVLATNFQKNLDEAFLRRLHDVIEFPFPDAGARERIWRGHFPTEAPREPDLDFAFLGKQFNLTGGSIRNIVLNAAFLASYDDVRIGMSHLLAALRSEYQKQGKLLMSADLGPYAGALHSEGIV